MNDPYKILNVPSDASDDEVKKAYRDLARKYHPDNYADNPLADLAQEKMKEINEAYETIQKQRRSASQSYSGYGGGATASAYQSYSSTPVMQQVRLAINRGDITTAERLLNNVTDRNGEWNFLRGKVCQRRGWMDEAKRYYQTACQMEPGNPEFRAALDYMSTGGAGGYRPQGYQVFSTSSCGNDGCSRLCMAWVCCNLLGGGGCYFCPGAI